MRPAERLTLALVAACLLSATALLPLSQDRLYLGFTLALIAASAGLTSLARRLRAPGALARLLGLLPGVVVITQVDRWPELFAETTDFAAHGYAPMDPHAGFRLLCALALWALYLVAEGIGLGLRQPAWTFPVLVLPYLVPAIVLPAEASLGYLLLTTGGYVLVLAVAVYNRFAGTPRPGMRRGVAVAASASLIAAWALTGITSILLPERATGPLDPGQLNTAVQLGDPTVDLIRNLRAPSDRVILSYRTSDGDGRYLRLAALSSFDAAGFHLVAADLVPGPINPPAGDSLSARAVDVDVVVKDFASEWLPVPWVPTAFDAPGNWRVDPGTLAIVAVGDYRKLATRFLEYSVTSRDLTPAHELVAAATAGDPGDGGLTLGLPPELDPAVVELAEAVTVAADTDGERVLALLAWLRSDRFTYSTQVVEGTTMDSVSDFLLASRTGYCEQFSGSMAILARSLGIPSRVVVGFLPGHKTDAGYNVSVRDMHAWTEVYLTGLGWVAFDPTPSGAPGVAPLPTPTTGTTPSVVPTAPQTSRRAPNPAETGAAAPAPDGTLPSLPTWSWAIVGGFALAAVPALVRRGRHWWRLRPGREPGRMAEDAWDELRDCAVDAGLVWPAGTPRQVAAALALVLDAESTAAAAKLASEVERARFAPAVEPAGDLAEWVGGATAGLRSTRSAGRRWPRLFPRSVLRPQR